MTTKLEKTLKREIDIAGAAYTVTISPAGVKITEKGKRLGREIAWKDLVTGEAALAAALTASVDRS